MLSLPKLATLVTALLALTPPAAGPPPENLAMEARLRAIYRATDWKVDPTKPALRAAYFQALLATGKLTPDQQRIVYPQLTNELLRAGDPEASLAALAAYEKVPGLTPAEIHDLHSVRAQAYLRLGEQQNCLTMHGQRACVFPLRASAVHTRPEGAQGAIAELTWLLEHPQPASPPGDPDALSRWLLNIAYMQLGQYPARVPAKYLLPPKLFASEADLGEFLDYSSLAGVDVTAHAGGAIVEDFDGDGQLDIVTSSSGPLDPMHLFHNNGDGTFSDWSERSGLSHSLGGLNILQADFDNDGHPDILVLRGGWWGQYGNYPVSLLHNRGDGTFEDVTEHAGLLKQGAIGPTQTAAWADYDNDGYLDLFIGYEPLSDPAASGGARRDPTATTPCTSPSRPEPNPSTPTPSSRPERNGVPGEHARWGESAVERPAGLCAPNAHPSLLFHNNGNGTFTEVAQSSGLAAQGFVKGVAWGDFNNDGRPDLYLSTHDGHNRLLRNDGPADPTHPDPAHWRFTDVTAAAGLTNPGPTFATWFFDYNNDGWPDLFVAGYYADSMQDVGRFEAGEPFHAGVPHLYRNNRDGTFTDVSHQLHLDRAILTMGANFGDLDNDGWLDLYLGNGEPSYQALLPNRLFRNNAAQSFQDITTSSGLGHLQKGHAVAFADIEQRGDEDIFEEMGGAFPGDPYQAALYRNPGHPANHSVTLRLEGTRSNRAAYGARIEAVFRDPTAAPTSPPRHIFRTVGSVSSFGANPTEQHLGLGKAARIDELHIRWPATWPHEQIFRDLTADQIYRIREGDPTPQTLPRKPATLGQHALHPDALQPSMPAAMAMPLH